jgi:hypothetical protein
MSTIVKDVNKKLKQYNIVVYNKYKIDEDNEYIYYTNDMILFVNENEESIGIAFQATTKPERSATLALILKQTGYSILIMDPFILSNKREIVSGEEAYELIEQTRNEKIMEKVNKEHLYTKILENSNCYEC